MSIWGGQMKKNKKKRPRPKSKPKPKQALPAEINKQQAYPSLVGTAWTWVGVFLTTFSLFAALQTIIDLSAWARCLVTNWQWAIETFWSGLFRILGLEFVQDAAGPLTFYVSMLGIAFSGMLLEEKYHPRPVPKSFWRLLLETDLHARIAQGFGIAFWALVLYREAIEWYVFGNHFDIIGSRHPWLLLLSLGLALLMFIVIGLYYGWTHLAHALMLTVFIAAFYFAISLPAAFKAKAAGPEEIAVFRAAVLDLSVFYIAAHIAGFLAWARPQFLNMRFLWVLLSLTLILALNFISLLGISLRAPE
jgi:hypothetical protein